MTIQKERADTAPRRGNRALLTAGLAAALTAVACLVALQSSAGASQAPAQTAAVADAQQAQQAAATAKAADHTIEIKNYAFSQPKLTVKVGETVKWTNEDTAPHTVTTTSGPAKFDSGNLGKGESWSYTFTKAGTYQYYCAVHPDMTASVTVVDDGSGTSGGSTSGGSTSGGSSSGGSTTGGTTTGGTTGGSTGGDTSGSTGGMTTGGTSTGTSTGGSTSGSTSGGTSGSTSSGSTGGSGGGSECYDVQQVLLPILQHLNSAHLGESPGQQVQDALALDSYIKMHTVWIESILTPLVNGGGATVDNTLTVLLAHIKSAHLEESLGQQVQDLLNPDAYIKMHTVWAANMLQPAEDYLTASC